MSKAAWQAALAGLHNLQHDIGSGKKVDLTQKACTTLEKVEKACEQSRVASGILLDCLNKQKVVLAVACTAALAFFDHPWITYRLLPPLAQLVDGFLGLTAAPLVVVQRERSPGDSSPNTLGPCSEQFTTGLFPVLHLLLPAVTKDLQRDLEHPFKPAAPSSSSSGSSTAAASGNSSSSSALQPSPAVTAAALLRLCANGCAVYSHVSPTTKYKLSRDFSNSHAQHIAELAATAIQQASNYIARHHSSGSSCSPNSCLLDHLLLARAAFTCAHEIFWLSVVAPQEKPPGERLSASRSVQWLAVVVLAVHTHQLLLSSVRDPLGPLDDQPSTGSSSSSSNSSSQPSNAAAASCAAGRKQKSSSSTCQPVQAEGQHMQLSDADAWACVCAGKLPLQLLPSHSRIFDPLGCHIKLVEWLGLTAAPTSPPPYWFLRVLLPLTEPWRNAGWSWQGPSDTAYVEVSLLLPALLLQWTACMHQVLGEGCFRDVCSVAGKTAGTILWVLRPLLLGSLPHQQQCLQRLQPSSESAAAPARAPAAACTSSQGQLLMEETQLMAPLLSAMAAAPPPLCIIADVLQLLLQLLQWLQPAVACGEGPLRASAPTRARNSSSGSSSSSSSSSGSEQGSDAIISQLLLTALGSRARKEPAAMRLLDVAAALSLTTQGPGTPAYSKWRDAWQPCAAAFAAHLQAAQRGDESSSAQDKLDAMAKVLPVVGSFESQGDNGSGLDGNGTKMADDLSEHYALVVTAFGAAPGAPIQQQLLGLLYYRMKLVHTLAAGRQYLGADMQGQILMVAVRIIKAIHTHTGPKGEGQAPAVSGAAAAAIATVKGQSSAALTVPWLVLMGRCCYTLNHKFTQLAAADEDPTALATPTAAAAAAVAEATAAVAALPANTTAEQRVQATLMAQVLEAQQELHGRATTLQGKLLAMDTALLKLSLKETLPLLAALLLAPQQSPLLPRDWTLVAAGQQLQQHLSGAGIDLQPLQNVLQAVLEFVHMQPKVMEERWQFGFLEQLESLGLQLCALPCAECCNNPSCCNVTGLSECELVKGSGKVCSGCRMARYCSHEPCQVSHWKGHRPVCKAIKAASKKGLTG